MRARNPLVSVSIDTSTRRCLTGCPTRRVSMFQDYGALGPLKRALIHPFKLPLFTCAHSPLRSRTSSRVPFGSDPTTEPVSDGVDLTFTPGRCKKTYGEL